MRRFIIGALLACAACKGNGASKASKLDQRCEQLAKTCGDTDKHVEALLDGCKHAATTQQSCAAEVSALYDCYEKQVCGKGDRIWAFEDFGVLAVRNKACAAERKAVGACK